MEHESDQELTSLNSLEHIRASEVFPKKQTFTEDGSLTVTFPLLFGEYVGYLGRTAEGIIALSSFRLFIHMKDTFFNIPIGLIEQVECRDIFFLHVYCKDARSLRCTFSTNEHCLEWYKRLLLATSPPKRLEDLFAFAHYAWCSEESHDDVHQAMISDGPALFNISSEAERMGFDLKNVWRISDINKDHKFCPTYPKQILVPSSIKDEDLEHVANFRSSRRIPVVVWRHQGNGSVIARCSQPEVGWLGWRNSHDEDLVQAIAKACANDVRIRKESLRMEDKGNVVPNGHTVGGKEVDEKICIQKVLIVDARSYAAAVANRAKGGGCECPEYYPNCEIQFMSLPNIHSIRKSFHSVRALCASSTDQTNWFSMLEGTRWLHHMSGLLKAALMVVNSVDRDGRPVLVHCSDGWDRTPQIVALAELMLDPFYRTMDGFQILIEREWLEFGHKFGDRCGHGIQAEDTNERCPVFLQWLDCIHQLLFQFPCCFEFNEAYLVKLAQHAYTCLFGTFLCNSSLERQTERIQDRTYSIWAFFKVHQSRFRNFLYSNRDQVLHPACHIRDLTFWSNVYAPASATTEEFVQPALCTESIAAPIEVAKNEKEVNCNLVKTRSCDDLLSAVEHLQGRQRRSSDPMMDGKRTFSQNLADEGNENNSCEVAGNVPSSVAVTIASCSEVSPFKLDGQSEDDDQSVASKIFPLTFNGCLEDEIQSSAGNQQRINKTNSKLCVEIEDKNCEFREKGSEQDQLTAVCENRCANGVPSSRNDSTAFESSTDTLVGGESGNQECDAQIENLECGTTLTASNDCKRMRTKCNLLEQTGVSGKVGSLESCTVNENVRGLETSSSVSTSTSDISDSHISVKDLLKQNSKVNGHSHSWSHAPPCTKCPICTSGRKLLETTFDSFKGAVVSSSGRNSVNSTPLHSRTPSSGFPATPNDERVLECSGSRSSTMLAHKLDMDGLTMIGDEVQHQLYQLISAHMMEVNKLKSELYATRLALYQQVCHKCSFGNQINHEHADEVVSLPDSVCSGEQHSIGQESNCASDVSWEPIEERDTRPTLWVPDHAVTRCTGCDIEFWLGRRKHHCRNCGNIFCAECSKQMVPIPSEQLYHPVRVCSSCYENLRTPRCKQAYSDTKLTKPIVTTAAASN